MEKQQIVDPSEPFTYESGQVPSTYKCGRCGRTHVKLWRDYNTLLDYQELVCAPCITEECKEKGEDRKCETNNDGFHRWADPHGFEETDQAPGTRMPAVPTEDNDTFWGYTSVPQSGVIWWNNLALGYKE